MFRDVVVDTNVLVVANEKSPQATFECKDVCTDFLQNIEDTGRINIDDNYEIMGEYENNVDQEINNPGSAFLKWIHNNYRNPDRCRIHYLNRIGEPFFYAEYPQVNNLIPFDNSDKKFVAVAVCAKCPIFNAVDPDWQEHIDALTESNIEVQFLC